MAAGGATAGTRLLVVEDDEPARRLLERMLELEGYEVTAVASSADASEAAARARPQLVLLDLSLPDGDGLSVLEEVRRRSPGVGCIIVSGRDDEANRVLGLRLGADDYVVKPFSAAELLARVESVLRRLERPLDDGLLRRGELTIDVGSREVRVAGRPVELTAREYDLLVFLASAPRQVFSRNQLMDQVWSSSSDWQDPATVTEHVRRLRKKLEEDPDAPKLIETVRGVGYRFSGV